MLLTVTLVCALSVPTLAYDMGKVGENNVLSLSFEHGAAIDKDNSLWAWGPWDFSGMFYGPGQYGGTRPSYATPQKDQEDIVAVSCGENQTAVIRKDGSLWLWGENMFGAVGVDKALMVVYKPTKVLDNVAAVSCGYSHTAAIRNDGSLWVWGSNDQCELGLPEIERNTDLYTPTKLMDDVVAVSCGYHFTAAIKSDGSLWTWGNNSRGQLGNDGVGDGGTAWYFHQTTPLKVLDDVVAVSCGDYHAAAIKTDGSLWIWGENDERLGVNIGNKKYAKVPMKVLDHVVAVSCGYDHTAAIKEDGTLWMWGDNAYGQLGNGWTGNTGTGERPKQNLPLKVLDNVSAVRCGKECTVAIQNDGSLWTWGLSKYNRLGNGGGYDKRTGSGNLIYYLQTLPTKILDNVTVPVVYDTPVPEEEISFPAQGIAYPSTQTVDVDGRSVVFQCYALKDAAGNDTNYIKLRDLADILNGSAVQFDVGWNGQVTITTSAPYIKNGSEQNTPFSGQREYKEVTAPTIVNGVAKDLSAFSLTDDNGGGYTYYKLRDLGTALGFKVDWSAERGIFIETK